MKALRKKWKQTSGFSLAELLVALLILLMVTSIVTTGIPVAKSAYEKVVLTSNAQVLLSTTGSTLRNELGTARNVEISDTAITYYKEYRATADSPYQAHSSVIKLGADPDDSAVTTILYQRYAPDRLVMSDSEIDSYNASHPFIRLISQETATDDMYVIYDSVTPGDGVVTFHKLQVMKKGRGDALVTLPELKIRVMTWS